MAGMVRSLCLCWRLVRVSAVVMMTGKLMRGEFEENIVASLTRLHVYKEFHIRLVHISPTHDVLR